MRRKRRKQRKIIILTSIALLFVLTTGYAAFQTNLNLTAKGNILEKGITIDELKSNITTSGDGLYIDTYEENRYIYKGANPNNYITFNDEFWRIISIESDNTIKIIKNESIGNMIFDDTNSNDWARPASLNTYLNTTYYNSLSEDTKSKIVSHDFNVGPAEWSNTDLKAQIQSENGTKWKGNVGLINESEYIRVNTNTAQCGNHKLAYDNRTVCPITNYINSIASNSETATMWTITKPYSSNTMFIFWINPNMSTTGNQVKEYAFGIHPVVYLNKDIKLKGEGTEANPYKIITN